MGGRGLDFDPVEAEDFNLCINNCALMEAPCMGSQFTWWNGHI